MVKLSSAKFNTRQKLSFWLFIIGFIIIGLVVWRFAFSQNPQSLIQVSVPSTIAKNCSVDVSDKLQEFINSTADGSAINFASGDCYLVNKTISLNRRYNIYIRGNGARFKQSTDGRELGSVVARNRSIWQIELSDTITIDGVVLEGANHLAGEVGGYKVELEAQHGFELNGSSNITLTNNSGGKVYGDFVCLCGGGFRETNTNVLIAKNNFYAAGRQGIALAAGENVLIENNKVAYVSRSLLDIEPDLQANSNRNITFFENEFGAFKNQFFSNLGSDGVIEDVAFVRNFTTGTTNMVSTMRAPSYATEVKRKRFWFLHNTSAWPYGSPTPGEFQFRNVDDIEFVGNNTPLQKNQPTIAISLEKTRNVNIRDNTFKDAPDIAYDRGGNSNVAICSNRFDPLAAFDKPSICSTPATPFIVKLSQKVGPQSGNNKIIIIGENFTPNTSISVGNTKLSVDRLAFVDSRTIEVTMPPNSPGISLVVASTVGVTRSSNSVAYRYSAASDQIAPVASFVDPTPADGSYLSSKNGNPANKTIKANVADNVGIERVELLLDGKVIGGSVRSNLQTNIYEWTLFNVENYSLGNHVLEIRAYDYSGNVSQNSSQSKRQYFVDNRVPNLVTFVNLPATITGIIDITCSTRDYDGESGIGKVELFLDDALIDTKQSAPYIFSFNSLRFSNGTHKLSCKSSDKANNSITANAQIQILNDTPNCTLAGDVNCDGEVTLEDFGTVVVNYGRNNVTRAQGDVFGNDGAVTLEDYSTVVVNFGNKL